MYFTLKPSMRSLVLVCPPSLTRKVFRKQLLLLTLLQLRLLMARAS